ncbi:MAG: AgmX/PglI C-terminal domain-containing protein [bacterium]
MENTPIKFDIYQGGQLVRTEILTEPTIKIGKLTSSHVRVDDDSVSRMHAVVEVGGPNEVVILDLGSTSGTFVNGERVTKQSLRSGDRIQLGSVVMVITIAGQAVGTDGAAAPVPTRPAQTGPLYDEEEDLGSGRALEVLAMWGPTVVDVRHIEGSGQYTIGDAAGSDHFVDPRLLPEDPYPLAISDGNDIIVHVPEGVVGEVMLDGKVYGLEELKAAGKLGRAAVQRSHGLRLPARARCRLEFGELTFLINSVAAAPPVARSSFIQQLDPQLLRYLFSAAVLHALFFLIILSIPEDADGLSMDGFNDADRFVEFILKPEEEKEDPLKDLFKGLDEDEGKMAEKAKDEEGQLGKKDSEEKDKRFAVKGPQDNEEIKLAKERAKMEAIRTADAAFNQLEGELSAVWGEGDRAVGSDAVSALGNMFGDTVGEAQGFGGLGTVGVGRGGGGFGEASIGVGNVGTRGRGGAGGGGRGYGRGAARLGDREAKVPKVIPGQPIITGSLDKETIRRVIRQHRAEYRYCYEKELNRKRELNGKITVKFTIAGNGSVIAASIDDTTMNDSSVETCLVGKIRRWVFPAPKGGGIVVVKYPFIFKPS